MRIFRNARIPILIQQPAKVIICRLSASDSSFRQSVPARFHPWIVTKHPILVYYSLFETRSKGRRQVYILLKKDLSIVSSLSLSLFDFCNFNRGETMICIAESLNERRAIIYRQFVTNQSIVCAIIATGDTVCPNEKLLKICSRRSVS